MTTYALNPVNELDFDRTVLAASMPVLVDFTAAWCSPCRALKPLLQELATELQGELRVVTVDADEAPSLSTRFGVRGFPTLLLFAEGREVARSVGLCSRAQLRRLVGRARAA